MPRFVIEREIPGAGKMTDSELHDAALKSIEVLKNLGPQIQWLHSYVTDNKVYCIYLAPNQEMILEHAKRSGFPANRISAVRRMLDATAAE
jgi:cell division inhibitor SulA